MTDVAIFSVLPTCFVHKKGGVVLLLYHTRGFSVRTASRCGSRVVDTRRPIVVSYHVYLDCLGFGESVRNDSTAPPSPPRADRADPSDTMVI